jgi:molybdate transport system ATP-binding protein
MEIAVDIKKKLGSFKLDVQFQASSKRIGILGASGCGKSMTLKSIAGIETPDEGSIRIGDSVLFDSAKRINVKPQKRNIGYLFQNYALFPTMTVAKNIEAGLKGSKEENQKRVKEMVEKFQLNGLEDRLPGQLSGGQQERVALARIMAYEPDVILLDEPFSALDVFLKDRLQQEMKEMLKDYPGIVIMVSHSRDEIYRFSDELLIMDKGTVVACGETKEIFAEPKQREAARLTGCKNFSDIRRIDAHTAELTDWGITLHVKGEVPKKATCIGYRAHDFVPVWGERKENCLKVTVESMAELPFEDNYYLRPENKNRDENANKTVDETANTNVQDICWFVQREKAKLLEEKGIPDYLELVESAVMFLEG